jgi:hypothetical protein
LLLWYCEKSKEKGVEEESRGIAKSEVYEGMIVKHDDLINGGWDWNRITDAKDDWTKYWLKGREKADCYWKEDFDSSKVIYVDIDTREIISCD